jgi:hypothetical protein
VRTDDFTEEAEKYFERKLHKDKVKGPVAAE